jgi:hypothetical protein
MRPISPSLPRQRSRSQRSLSSAYGTETCASSSWRIRDREAAVGSPPTPTRTCPGRTRLTQSRLGSPVIHRSQVRARTDGQGAAPRVLMAGIFDERDCPPHPSTEREVCAPVAGGARGGDRLECDRRRNLWDRRCQERSARLARRLAVSQLSDSQSRPSDRRWRRDDCRTPAEIGSSQSSSWPERRPGRRRAGLHLGERSAGGSVERRQRPRQQLADAIVAHDGRVA